MSHARAVLWGGRTLGVPVLLSLLAVGCVPYSVHQATKEQLVLAKEANADLVKKYNSAIQELMRKRESGGVSLAEYQKLKSDYDALQAQAGSKSVRPQFTDEDLQKVPGSQSDDGGLALGDALLFAEGSADLKREAFGLLDNVASLLKNEHPGEPVIIEGHTDNQPLKVRLKEFGDNLTLGYARAHAVYKYLESKGVAADRMTAHTYADTKPFNASDVSSASGRSRNRRVVVRLGTSRI